MIAEEIRGLMEAYSQVHTPDPVYIAAELWVSACIEEGVDFSQYTLDEITEGFIIDMNSEDLSESLLSEVLGMPGAQNLGAGLRQGFGKARRAVGSAIGNVARGAADVAGAYGQGFLGQKTTSKNPAARAYNATSRFLSAPTRATGAFLTGLATGQPASKPGASPTKPVAKPAPAKPGVSNIPPTTKNSPYNIKNLGAAQYSAYKLGGGDAAMSQGKGTAAEIIARGRKANQRLDSGPRKGNPNIVGSPVVGSKKPAPTAPATKPAPTAPAAAKPTAPTPPKPGTQAAGPESIKPKTPNPLMQRTFGYQTGNAPDQIAKASAGVSKEKSDAAFAKTKEDIKTKLKPSPNLNMSLDLFDIVKGHLLDEGYADTEDAALAIMANMSEEWKQSIVEQASTVASSGGAGGQVTVNK